MHDLGSSSFSRDRGRKAGSEWQLLYNSILRNIASLLSGGGNEMHEWKLKVARGSVIRENVFLFIDLNSRATCISYLAEIAEASLARDIETYRIF